MESFVINYRDINIKVECNLTIKNLITENLKGHVNFLDDVYNETYRLVIADEINGKGIKGQMVDKWFDNAMLDCYIDNTNRICYATNFRASTQKNKELLIQYFVANLFYRFLEIDGYIGIHSACVETDNKGILFVADRMSGKTNCILNLMHDGFNFVANKKVALKKCEDDIIGYGVSQPVSIRLSPSFCSQPQNYKYVELAKKRGIIIKNEDALEGNNICIDESKLVKMNGVKQTLDVPIKYIVRPVYDPFIDKVVIKEMGQEQTMDLILSQYLSLVHETKDFLKNIRLQDQYVDKKIEMIKQLVEVPNFVCYQNEKTTKDFVKVMNNILR